ncbi:MAG: serpin family protein [Polyangiales bacterium]
MQRDSLLWLATGVFAVACSSTPSPAPPDAPTDVPQDVALDTGDAPPGDVPPGDVQDADVAPTDADAAVMEPETLRSMRGRSPAATDDLAALAQGNADFGLALHRAAVPATGNTVMSPYSVSTALAMARAGAVGTTGTEIDTALRFTLTGDRLHGAFNAADLALAGRPAEATAADPEPAVPRPALRLRVANDVWVQRGLPVVPAYLDTLGRWYGAGARVLDFAAAPDPSRRTINAWISSLTEARVPELIPAGTIDGATKVVLTNAVYFNARWLHRFNPDYTAEGVFTRVDGTTVNARMMSGGVARQLPYAEGAGWRAVELPYVGDRLAMLVVVPDAGTFADFERSFDGARYRAVTAALGQRLVSVRLPRFTARLPLLLRGPLESLGMRAAFTSGADFSGITPGGGIFIEQVVHEGFIEVTEAGTEAAAATAVIFADSSVQPDIVNVSVDRPFYYVIRDRPTGAMLFVGRVVDPTR